MGFWLLCVQLIVQLICCMKLEDTFPNTTWVDCIRGNIVNVDSFLATQILTYLVKLWKSTTLQAASDGIRCISLPGEVKTRYTTNASQISIEQSNSHILLRQPLILQHSPWDPTRLVSIPLTDPHGLGFLMEP